MRSFLSRTALFAAALAFGLVAAADLEPEVTAVASFPEDNPFGRKCRRWSTV